MKKRVFVLLAAVALLLVGHPSTSHAQNVTFITVDFPFVVHDRTVPPGTYVLRLNPDMSGFTLTQTDTPAPADALAVQTLKRLATLEPPVGNTHVEFDKVGDKYYLSEIWLPDEDGWLVYATTEQHTRRTVKGRNKM